MRAARTWLALGLCSAASFASAGCSVEAERKPGGRAGEPAADDGGAPLPPRPDGGPAAVLVIEGDMRLRLEPGQEAMLRVRLLEADEEGEADESAPLGAFTVRFDLVGQAQDSGLTRSEALTDVDGYASTTLRAGAQPAAFEVQVGRAGARAVSYDVAVSGAGFGTLNAIVEYEGSRSVQDRFVRAYPEQECAGLDASTNDPARALVPGEESARLIALPAGIRYAVQAFARGSAGAVIASACAPNVMVAADATTDVVIVLENEAVEPAEALALELQVRAFNAAAAVSSTLHSATDALIQQPDSAYETQGAFWLEALGAALREDGDARRIALADAIEEARTSMPIDGPDDALERMLGIHEEGVRVASDTLGEEVRDAMRELTIDAQLAIEAGAERASVQLTRIASAPLPSDDAVLSLDLSASEPSEAEIVLSGEIDALELRGLRFEPRFGALASKVMRRLLSEDGRGEALRTQAGCGSLAMWLDEQTLVDASACDAECVDRACTIGMGELQQAAQDALLALDEARPSAELSMMLELRDDDGDLVAEEMSSESLLGEWEAAAGAVVGDSFTGSAIAHVEP